MGKWAFIRDLKFPRFVTKHLADAPDEEKDRIRLQLAGQSDTDIAEQVCGLKRHKAELEDFLRNTNIELEMLSQVLIDRWLAIGQEKAVYDFGTLSISDEPYPSVVDKVHAFAWLRRRKLGDLIREEVSWKALQSAIKELAADGAPLPDEAKDGIKLYIKQSLSVRGAKGKEAPDEG
jgi:hypothetical protein